jgi:hypothetical protein
MGPYLVFDPEKGGSNDAFDWAVAVTALPVAGQQPCPGTFKITYEFEAGGKAPLRILGRPKRRRSPRAGSDWQGISDSFTKRLLQPSPALEEPQLVFDMVGNLRRRIRIVTDYVLAEVYAGRGWIPCMSRRGAQDQTIKGQKAK